MAERFWFVLVLALVVAGCSGYEETPLPEDTAGPDIHLVPDIRVVEDQVARNATFETLLVSHDMGDVSYAFVEAVRPVFDPADIRAAPRRPVRPTLPPAARGARRLGR